MYGCHMGIYIVEKENVYATRNLERKIDTPKHRIHARVCRIYSIAFTR